MKIGVDAGMLGITDARLQVGVWRVAKELLSHLASIDRVNSYVLYSFHPIEKSVLAHFGNRMENRVITPSLGWMKIRLPLELSLYPVDVFLGLSQALPFTHIRSIGFVYDLGFLSNPEFYPDSFSELTAQTESLTNRASEIVTISQTVKNEIISTYDYPRTRIHVAYPGVTTVPNQKTTDDYSKPYFLSVGSFKRSKNISFLLQAFSRFQKISKTPTTLILVGSSYWQDPSIYEVIKKEHLERSVIIKGYVNDEQLSVLYQNALAFVSPTFVEGFGLPFIEAMAHGTPVIGSNISVLKEIVGQAGILVENNDIDSLVAIMEKISRNKSLRERLIRDGKKMASRYTWEEMANSVYNLL